MLKDDTAVTGGTNKRGTFSVTLFGAIFPHLLWHILTALQPQIAPSLSRGSVSEHHVRGHPKPHEICQAISERQTVQVGKIFLTTVVRTNFKIFKLWGDNIKRGLYVKKYRSIYIYINMCVWKHQQPCRTSYTSFANHF